MSVILAGVVLASGNAARWLSSMLVLTHTYRVVPPVQSDGLQLLPEPPGKELASVSDPKTPFVPAER